ncbi:M28 family metallopeptidase [Lentisphaerota bacterium ZTH]|nr:Zn-dependent exopeptidase M28 [Lentisphaerota bacterium]WET06873.1 M28 family metallopeptidase [Lentisphaerota bacterium ZTH]
MKLIKTTALLLIFSVCCGCGSKEVAIPLFDKNNAFDILKKIVAFGNRPSGTAENFAQIEYIYNTAKKYGAVCRKQAFTNKTPLGDMKFVNVEAVLPGTSKEFIIIGCHFDTKRLPGNIKFQGANDGASGVAVSLEMIRAIKDAGIKPSYSLYFVFFDGEECIDQYGPDDGLFGSRYYARELERSGKKNLCRGVIVLDMVGDRDLKITLPSSSSEIMLNNLHSAVKKHGLGKYFEVSGDDILDDQYPFQKIGIPAIDIIDFNFGPGNSFWHTSADNLDAVSGESLGIVGTVALEMVLNGRY